MLLCQAIWIFVLTLAIGAEHRMTKDWFHKHMNFTSALYMNIVRQLQHTRDKHLLSMHPSQWISLKLGKTNVLRKWFPVLCFSEHSVEMWSLYRTRDGSDLDLFLLAHLRDTVKDLAENILLRKETWG